MPGGSAQTGAHASARNRYFVRGDMARRESMNRVELFLALGRANKSVSHLHTSVSPSGAAVLSACDPSNHESEGVEPRFSCKRYQWL